MGETTNSDEKIEILWTENNLARYSNFLFTPNNSCVANVERRYEFKSDGSIPEYIEIVPSIKYPTPDQFCYDILLSLVSIWSRQGYKGVIHTSYRAIGREAYMGKISTNGIKRIRQALLSLHYTNIHFFNTWVENKNNKEYGKTVDFNIISLKEELYRIENFKANSTETLKISISDYIGESIAKDLMSPASLKVRRQIKNTISRMIYSFADRVISVHGIWTKNGDSLIADLSEHRKSLENKNHTSKHISLLQSIRADLDGKLTFWGATLSAVLEESKSSDLPKLVLTAPKAKNNVISANFNEEEIQFNILDALVLWSGLTEDKIRDNGALNRIVNHGDQETVFIAISSVKEDIAEFKDVENPIGFFVDRFKKISSERGSKTPFL